MELDELWPILEKAIIRVYDIDSRIRLTEYMGLYSLVYDHCLKGMTMKNPETKPGTDSAETTSLPATAEQAANIITVTTVNTSASGTIMTTTTSANPTTAIATATPSTSSGQNQTALKRGSITLQFRKAFPQVLENTNLSSLYRKLDDFLRAYTFNLYQRMRLNTSDKIFLPIFSNQWSSYKQSSKSINSIFSYMNRLIAIQNQKGQLEDQAYPVFRLAMLHWRDNILLKLDETINNALSSHIEDDRRGKNIDRAMMRNVISCYVDLSFQDKNSGGGGGGSNSLRRPHQANSDNSVRSMSQSTSSFFTSIGTNTSMTASGLDDWDLSLYRRHFEHRFLNETALFYKAESNIYFTTCGFTLYVQHVKKRLYQETERLQKANASTTAYIHESTALALKAVCLTALIEDHIETIKEESKNLLKYEKYPDLKEVYNMLKDTPVCLDELRTILAKHIEKTGKEAIFRACVKPKPSDQIGTHNLCKRRCLEGDVVMDLPVSVSDFSNHGYRFNLNETNPETSSLTERETPPTNEKLNNYDIDPMVFVQTIISIYEKYEKIINDFLMGDARFLNALQIGCVNFFKNNALTYAPEEYKPVQLVASYYNLLLRKAEVMENDPDYEDKLRMAFIVFQLIEDKDLFQKYFNEHLANRLLIRQNYCVDNEKLVINRFKEICGLDYTAQMQRMIKDMDASVEENGKFLSYLTDIGVFSEIDFNINILSCGSWPLQKEIECLLPSDFQGLIEHFENYYFGKHTGRKLIWLMLTSKVTLNTSGFNEEYIVKANVLQTVVLLKFNTKDNFSFQELVDLTKTPPDVLQSVVENLCNVKILNFAGGPPMPNPEAKIEINESFVSKKKTLNLYGKHIKIAEVKPDPKPKYIKDERRYVIEAAIVRIMKARGKLSHYSLVEEVLNLLSTRFKPTMKLIKTCIENLLDKEYLARDEDDGNTYIYLA